jgi:hypothetical protein
VKELIGNRALKHVLVVPPISDRQRGDVEAYAKERKVEFLEWAKLIEEMISFVDVQRNARNQTDHVLRILLKYGFLNPPVGPSAKQATGQRLCDSGPFRAPPVVDQGAGRRCFPGRIRSVSPRSPNRQRTAS